MKIGGKWDGMGNNYRWFNNAIYISQICLTKNSYSTLTNNTKTHCRGLAMLIKSCLNCKFHEVKQDGNEKMSYCVRENSYSRHSKCIVNKALNRFLEQEYLEPDRLFSAIGHFKPLEQW